MKTQIQPSVLPADASANEIQLKNLLGQLFSFNAKPTRTNVYRTLVNDRQTDRIIHASKSK